jgi:uncharacterized protein (TIGR02996 family)
MTTREALIAAIAANPDDDLPRLVAADWFEENGDPERAEFIRLQIRAWRNPDADTLRTCTDRVKQLMLGRAVKWFTPMLAAFDPGRPLVMYQFVPRASWVTMTHPKGDPLIPAFVVGGTIRRGFVGWLTLKLDALPADADIGAALRAEPVETLNFHPTDYRNWERFTIPELQRVTKLCLGRTEASELGTVFTDPHLTGVRTLDLGPPAAPDGLTRVLAASPLGRQVTELSLMADEDTLTALADWQHSRVERLTMSAPAGGFSARSAALIAEAGFAHPLRSLRVQSRLNDEAVEALASATGLSSLTHLDCLFRHTSERALMALAAAEFVQQLEEVAITFEGGHPAASDLLPLALTLRPNTLRRLVVIGLGREVPAFLTERFGDRVVFR